MSFSFLRSSLNLSRMFSKNRLNLHSTIRKTLISADRINSRSFFYICRKPQSLSVANSSHTCTCGMHTKGDQELVAFLVDEIANEKKTQKNMDLNKFGDFECHFSGAEVTLTKNFNQEKIKIHANVSNSVDAEETVMDPNESKEQPENAMEAKPEFTVEVTKGPKTLSFHCTYNAPMGDEEQDAEPYNDSFQISEIAVYEGEYEDATYSVSGDIMDGYLYDLLMNYLEERGVSNDFADKLVTLFTHHEHNLYVNLLQSMKHFVEK